MAYSHDLSAVVDDYIDTSIIRQHINGLITKLRQKVQKMRFKISQPSTPMEELLDNGQQSFPPEERSTVLNDPANPFRTFIESIRTLVNNSVDEEGQEFVVVFGVDEETGYLSLGIARQTQKQEEMDTRKYKKTIHAAIQHYEKAQMHIINKHSQILERTKKTKAFYQSWKKRIEEASPWKMLHSSLMELVDNPRMGKQRSQSKDTAQTLEYYQPLINEEPEMSESSQVDLAYMLDVE